MSDTEIGSALLAQADALEAQAMALRTLALAHQTQAVPIDLDAPLPEKEIISRFRGTTRAWLHANVAACGRGSKGCRMYLPSAVRAGLQAAPVAPRPRTKRKATTSGSDDPIADMLMVGTVIARKARRD